MSTCSRALVFSLSMALTGCMPPAARHAGESEAAAPRAPAAVERAPDTARIGGAGADTAPLPGSFVERTYGAADGRSLEYRLYVPQRYGAGDAVPLVAMLHGCTQDALDFAAGTRMNDTADEEGFVVAYPEQPETAHPFRCWRWFEPEHQARGAGEPELIAGMVRGLLDELDIDPARVYVAGISAGAAMSVIMAAAYPDLFAAAAAHSGLVYAAAADEAAARELLGGRVPDAALHAGMAYAAMGERARPVPFLVFQGEADPIVEPAHGAELTLQWARTNRMAAGLDAAPPAPEETRGEAGGYGFTRRVYSDRIAGEVEYWSVEGLGHAWSGGSPAGSFTDDGGPDATREIARFLLRHRRTDS